MSFPHCAVMSFPHRKRAVLHTKFTSIGEAALHAKIKSKQLILSLQPADARKDENTDMRSDTRMEGDGMGL